MNAWGDDESEGYANELNDAARMSGIDIVVPPLVLGHRLDVTMSPLIQSHCRGQLDVADWRVRFDGRGPPDVVDSRLSHEFGHLGALVGGVSPPHCEACVDRVAMALWMPRAAILRIIRSTGLDIPRLIAAIPGVPPRWVLQRLAWVMGRPMIYRVGANERGAWAPPGWDLLPDHVERNVVNGVRATGKPQRARWGAKAWPCEALGAGGVVIVGECDAAG